MGALDKLDDNSPMPWGKFQGTKLVNVPADYLIWIKDNMKRTISNQNVFDYIHENLDVLQKEVRECSQ
jgi:hypothetical protein